MKYLCLLILAVFVQHISCNAEIFSKFHQHTFKIKDSRFELISYNKDLIEVLEVKVFKYNRTTVGHNCTLRLKVDGGDKLEVIVQGNKFLSNEYRHFPMRYQANIQKGFEANVGGVQAVTKCGNVTSFRFYKDITYHMCNFAVDDTYLPPLIPNGRYRLDLIILFLNKEVALLHWYNEVYTPIEYPKK